MQGPRSANGLRWNGSPKRTLGAPMTQAASLKRHGSQTAMAQTQSRLGLSLMRSLSRKRKQSLVLGASSKLLLAGPYHAAQPR